MDPIRASGNGTGSVCCVGARVFNGLVGGALGVRDAEGLVVLLRRIERKALACCEFSGGLDGGRHSEGRVVFTSYVSGYVSRCCDPEARFSPREES